MEIPVPRRLKILKKLWDVWDVRICISVSLFFQVLLGFFASWRQRSGNVLLLTLIWSAYLLADWIAAVAIGQITKGQIDSHKTNEDLYAFWAAFLLIHLGGPDSITSFALEDNELWLRHLFGLFIQVLAVAYTLFLTIPDNKIWLPAILLFFVGTVKFGERTYALYRASLDRFGATALPEPYPGPDYEEAVATYSLMRWVEISNQEDVLINAQKKNYLPVTVDRTPSSLDEMKLLQLAYSLFENFKGLIVGFLLSSKHRQSSRNFFLRITDFEAFRIVEYELSFVYQVLHTKVLLVRSRIGCILRIVCFCFTIVSLIMFVLIEKHGFGKFDTIITYVLLIGGLGLDILSFLKLIFSDWTLVFLKDSWTRRFIANTLAILKQERWSRSISQYNMIGHFLDGNPKWLNKLAGYLYLGDLLERMRILIYSSSVTISDELQCFIFNELKRRSLDANNNREYQGRVREASLQRGEWALMQTSPAVKSLLKWSIEEFPYAESLLLWHIATEVCCHVEAESTNIDDDDEIEERKATQMRFHCLNKDRDTDSTTTNDDDNNNNCKDDSSRICKLLSNYMFYLLVAQNSLLAPVLGNWHIVFQDTCAEAKRFFNKHSAYDFAGACEKIKSVKTKLRPSIVKGKRSKSVFFDACILAKQLRGLEKFERWKIMDQVWMELLLYAAINCRPITHAQQPSKGGQLLTITWMLMNHFGLGSQFYEEEQQD